jgi:hypothetical protein
MSLKTKTVGILVGILIVQAVAAAQTPAGTGALQPADVVAGVQGVINSGGDVTEYIKGIVANNSSDEIIVTVVVAVSILNPVNAPQILANLVASAIDLVRAKIVAAIALSAPETGIDTGAFSAALVDAGLSREEMNRLSAVAADPSSVLDPAIVTNIVGIISQLDHKFSSELSIPPLDNGYGFSTSP